MEPYFGWSQGSAHAAMAPLGAHEKAAVTRPSLRAKGANRDPPATAAHAALARTNRDTSVSECTTYVRCVVLCCGAVLRLPPCVCASSRGGDGHARSICLDRGLWRIRGSHPHAHAHGLLFWAESGGCVGGPSPHGYYLFHMELSLFSRIAYALSMGAGPIVGPNVLIVKLIDIDVVDQPYCCLLLVLNNNNNILS